MSVTTARSLSLFESTHPCQGSILSASLAPRPWHEPPDSTSKKPQAPRMLDEPIGSLLLHLRIQIRQPADWAAMSPDVFQPAGDHLELSTRCSPWRAGSGAASVFEVSVADSAHGDDVYVSPDRRAAALEVLCLGQAG